MAQPTPKPLPDVVFDKFQDGVALSPFLGTAFQSNTDITSAPGAVRCGFAATKQSASIITDLVKWIVRDPNNLTTFYALDKSQKLYKSTDSGVTWTALAGNASSGTGNGLGIYKDYLIIIGTIQMDAYGPLSGTPVFTNRFIANGFPGGGTSNQGLWGQDDIFYIGAGNYVSSLSQVSGQTFAPQLTKLNGAINSSVTTVVVDSGAGITNNDYIQVDLEVMQVTAGGGTTSLTVTRAQQSTSAAAHADRATVSDITISGSQLTTNYTFTAKALTLPTNSWVSCLAELGKMLMIGTNNALKGQLVANIYPWDRSSTSFELPLIFSGDGINSMATVGQFTYAMVGKIGQIYATDGYRAFPIKGFSLQINDTMAANPGAVMNYNGKFCVGFNGCTNSIYSSGAWSIDTGGSVYSIYNGQTILNNESNGSQLGSQTQVIGALVSINERTFLMAWQDGSSQGIDLIGASGYRTTGYATVVDTQFKRVGTPVSKRKFGSILVQLEKPLATGEGFRVGYRTKSNAAYTAINNNAGTANFDFATFGAITSLEIPAQIRECENIQIRFQMQAAASATDTPGLLEIRLRGGVV